MIKKIARKISEKFISEKIIKSEEQEIYDYCFEITLVSIISHFLLLILAIIFNEVMCSLVFLITFSFFRRLCGGYHAKSYVKCTIMSLLSFFLLILSVKKFSIIFSANFFNMIISLCIIILLSPMEDSNKPITKKQYKFLQIISRIVAVTLIIIFLILYIVFSEFIFENKFFFALCYGVNLEVVSLLISFFERRLQVGKV